MTADPAASGPPGPASPSAGEPAGQPCGEAGQPRGETAWEASTRDRIVDAAEACLRRYGLRRTSMGEIARLARLSRGSIYRYFSDRDALVLAALARADERYLRTARPAVGAQPTLTAQIAEAVGFVRRHRGDETALGLTGRPDEPELATLRLANAADVLERWIGFWTPFIAAAQARGEVRADLDPHAAGEWIMRIIISLVTVPSRSIDLDDPAALRGHLHEHLVRGMAPTGGTSRTGGTPPTDPGTAGRSTAWA